MGSLTDQGATAALDCLLGGSHGSASPDSWWLAASTTDPSVALTEPSGGGYTRVAITNDTTAWPAADSRQKALGEDIAFPTATADWGTITHVALLDSSTDGDMLAFDALSTAQPVTTGDVLSVPSGGLVFSI